MAHRTVLETSVDDLQRIIQDFLRLPCQFTSRKIMHVLLQPKIAVFQDEALIENQSGASRSLSRCCYQTDRNRAHSARCCGDSTSPSTRVGEMEKIDCCMTLKIDSGGLMAWTALPTYYLQIL